jgi:dTDP-4-amino-4,6-dideoxygalactose transaminase
VVVGINSRLDALQAAVLRAKIPRLEGWIAARREVAQHYRAALDPGLLDWSGPKDPAAESHHLFPILADDRDGLAAALLERGIASGVHYRVACPSTPAFGSRGGAFRVSEDRARRQLSLPIHPHLAVGEAARVANDVHTALARGAE